MSIKGGHEVETNMRLTEYFFPVFAPSATSSVDNVSVFYGDICMLCSSFFSTTKSRKIYYDIITKLQETD